MKFFLLISIFMSVMLISCGKSPEEHKTDDLSPYQLLTGTHALNAPSNWVDFGAVMKGKSYTRSVLFEAERDGRLYLSIGSNGVGLSCIEDDDIKFEIMRSVKLRRKGEDQLSMSIALKEGDFLILDLTLLSPATCVQFEINILATF
jgi:hypothetical protein